ncbi:hypothetical protein BKK51_08495 [Rodentibacter trehalosifermentans]|uniref:CdiI C-terminal domain-containing protein n=1 Tax=Rodentibacter trehalosifermentans TaxID=1908263 RepID=A0A1V3IR14_9PAST|nr:hypothetical protein [Rodentibacter trehalosifermentans]OOF44702.1 hypothetical protein BKK51_08495 [Rodentibacter trehalosifermentans]
MFGIFFKNENLSFDNGYGKHILAYIKLGNYVEELHIPIDYWGAKEYINSWISSLVEGLETQKHSVLITSMHESNSINFINSWIVYYDKENAFIQNKIIFTGDIPNFDISKINSYIGDRETVNEDGFKISEWLVKKKDVIDFYDSLKVKEI